MRHSIPTNLKVLNRSDSSIPLMQYLPLKSMAAFSTYQKEIKRLLSFFDQKEGLSPKLCTKTEVGF